MVFDKQVHSASAETPSPIIDGDHKKPITLAHISDPHISCMAALSARDLLSKRLFGFLRWKLHRGAEHGRSVLSALQKDLRHTKPAHIAVTGDLTHLGLPAEYEKARQWLQTLGSPSQVTVIPGNHDAYLKLNWHQTMAHWTEYMISDLQPDNGRAAQNTNDIFPSLRARGCIVIIGVSTAHPSALHLAVGSIGSAQMRKLEKILARTAASGLYRVLLIHHPPAPGAVSWRKRLTDAAELNAMLEKYGAELVLHGHAHRTLQKYLTGPAGNIPVMGVPAISALGRTPERRARYFLYRIEPGRDGYDVALQVRIYAPEKNRFTRENEQSWSTDKMPKTNNL